MLYVGVQIGFAFFITTLPGFSATTLIAPARDRAFVIVVGIFFSWLIFDQVWPVRLSAALHQNLKHVRKARKQLHLSTGTMHHATATETQAHLRFAVSLELANMRSLHTAAFFDFRHDRKQDLVCIRNLVRQIMIGAVEFYDELILITRREKHNL